jgi:hypothetical protein
MTRRCIFCLDYESKKRKLVEGNIVFNLEKKLLGVDSPTVSKGIHPECLNHLLSHLPLITEPAIFEIPVRVTYGTKGLKPIWLLSKPLKFLSKPLKFFSASGMRENGYFLYTSNWLKRVLTINGEKSGLDLPIPSSFDFFLKMLKQILEKEYDCKIQYYASSQKRL